jgi:O-antigen ligase
VALAAIAFVVTLSRSSVAGLLLGALVLEMAWLGRRKGGLAVLVTVLVLAVGLAGITELRHPRRLRLKLDTTRGLNKLTGGRVYLVKAGVRMFERHPIEGIGLGGFPLAFPYYRTSHAAILSLRDSHTTVVTVAAEQGLIGLAAFAFLLVTFFATTLRKRRFGADRRLYLWQASLVACVLAVFVHSLTYNAFFEDPYMWVFMALASAVATRLALAAPSATAADTVPADGGPDLDGGPAALTG